MNAEELRNLQTPLKDRYRAEPASALHTMKVQGELRQGNVTCVVQTPRGPIEAGLHPAAGGSGAFACSGDMLLEALVGCAGVTLAAVATAMNIPIRSAAIRAEATLAIGQRHQGRPITPAATYWDCLHLFLFAFLLTRSPEELQIKVSKDECVIERPRGLYAAGRNAAFVDRRCLRLVR